MGKAKLRENSGSEDFDGKNPDDWQTADEPMTKPQHSYLTMLCEAAGEEFNPGLTKAEASKKIDELRSRARGKK